MILSFLILTLAVAVAAALVFEFLPEHLSPFLELTLTCRTTFALIISPFFTGGFPTLESL
jgi:hypothetical protein